jgi:hypothetical protein
MIRGSYCLSLAFMVELVEGLRGRGLPCGRCQRFESAYQSQTDPQSDLIITNFELIGRYVFRIQMNTREIMIIHLKWF